MTIEDRKGKIKMSRRIRQILGGELSMRKALLRVKRSIESNSDYGDVISYDKIIVGLGIVRSIEKNTGKRGIGKGLGETLRILLNSYCEGNRSKVKVRGWYKEQGALQERIGIKWEEVGEQDVYRPMDYIEEGEQRRIIDDTMGVLVLDYGLSAEVINMDSSSSYFEGSKCEIGKKGYSRDHRPDRDQVNYDIGEAGGYVTRIGVHEGNEVDNRVIDKAVDEMEEVNYLSGAVLVVDKGMSLKRNRVKMLERGFSYVGSLEIEGETREEVEGIEEGGYKEEVTTGEGKDVYKVVRKGVKIKTKDGEVDVVDHIYYNEEKAKKEKGGRQERIEKAKAGVFSVQEQVEAGRLKRSSAIIGKAKRALKKQKVLCYFKVSFDKKTKKIILKEREEKLKKRERLDGKFVIQTPQVDWTSEEVLKAYRNHDGAEKVIDILKNVIEVRPIRHFNPQRVKAHIFLCIMACIVMAVLRYLSRQVGLTEGIVAIRDQLKQVKRVLTTLTIDDTVVKTVDLTGLTPKAKLLLEKIGVPLPQSPQELWLEVCL